MEDQQSKGLLSLAQDMAMNIIDTSTLDDENEEAIRELLQDKIYERRYGNDKQHPKWGKRVRNVLIIGAGASKDASSKFHTAIQLKNEIENQLPEAIREIFKKGYEAKKREDPQYELPFETVMAVLDNIVIGEENVGREYAKRILKEMFGYKYISSLFYEIVAHMFKERAIDVIINYNFDEILDNIIDEEMGRSNYHKIYFNGTCPEYKDLLIEERLTVPVYIKPHGTITHLGGLQYTFKQYGNNKPGAITKLIKTILEKGYTGNDKDTGEKEEQTLPVNIISVGYSLNDPDLSFIFDDLKAYAARRKKEKEFREKFTFYAFGKSGFEDFKTKSKHFEGLVECLGIAKRFTYIEGSIGANFKQLWQAVDDSFKIPEGSLKKIAPRNIAYQELTANLFNKSQTTLFKKLKFPEYENSDGENEVIDNKFKDYLERKMVIETALIIARCSGIFHLSQFKESKVAKYVDLYFKENFSSRSFNSFIDILKVFESGWTYYLGSLPDTFVVTDEYKKKEGDKTIVDAEKVFADADNYLSQPAKDYDTNLRLFKEASSDRLAKVVPDFKKHNVSFLGALKKENLIYSDTRWFIKFRNLFKQHNKWNIMLSSVENGTIFNNSMFDKYFETKNAKMAIILAGYGKDTYIPACFKNNPSKMVVDSLGGMPNGVRTLPWWLHNKHMAICFEIKEDGRIAHESGIYYTRRLLSNRATPVFIGKKDKGNVNQLFHFFLNYWVRSGFYREDKSALALEKENMLEGEEEKLLAILYASVYKVEPSRGQLKNMMDHFKLS